MSQESGNGIESREIEQVHDDDGGNRKRKFEEGEDSEEESTKRIKKTDPKKTPRFLIMTAVTLLVERLKKLKGVSDNEDILNEIDKLLEFKYLYNLCLVDFKLGLTTDMKNFTDGLLKKYGIPKKNIPKADLIAIQKGVQTITLIFKNEVFNKEEAKKS